MNTVSQTKNMPRKFESITVAQLIEVLQAESPDAIVAFSSNYGDICNTIQLHRINGEVQREVVCESGYSNSGFAVETDDDASGNQAELQTVLVIS
jgi:hypothetical protein